MSSLYRCDPQCARRFSEELHKLAAEHGFPQYLAIAAHTGGWALAQLGSANEGVEVGKQGIATWHAIGAGVALAGILGFHAESQLAAGEARAALNTTDEALSWVGRNGEHVYDCYLHCSRGDISHALREPDLASNLYEAAIDVARQQEVKFWELRASVHLARLWRDQGKRDEARELLAPVYGWFTEGFDTRDLKEAKALLDELAS